MYRNSAALCAAAAILLAACGSENGLVTSAAPIVAASRGVIVLDAPTYRSPAVVTITVADSDLNRHRRDVETFRVGITSNVSTYGEAPLLTETGPDTGIFTGTVPLRTRSYEPGRDGILDVMPGDTIVATYIDRNDGTGHEVTVTATATVDATPDIVADFVSLSVSGAVASITDRVHADENGAAVPAFSARVFLSTDPVLDGGDLLIRERSVAGMTRGSSADTQTIVQLSELTPGTYYAIAVYDVYDQVTEWSESNNVVVSAQTVFVSDPPPPAPEPDLVEDYGDERGLRDDLGSRERALDLRSRVRVRRPPLPVAEHHARRRRRHPRRGAHRARPRTLGVQLRGHRGAGRPRPAGILLPVRRRGRRRGDRGVERDEQRAVLSDRELRRPVTGP